MGDDPISTIPDTSDGGVPLASLVQAAFDAQRSIFAREFERFVNSPATPTANRREEVQATLGMLAKIATLAGMAPQP
jgi:hypothetical protein